MYAADQAGIKVIPPYVEALNAQRKWVRVVEDMGFPAGFERTMVADLTGKLPEGTRRIRLVNNLKIYWDAMRIDQTPEVRDVLVARVQLVKAALDFVGYAREIRLKPASDTIYSYSNRSMTGPYAHAAGNYTRYGDVFDLLRASDDRFVVFGSGEGLKLDFDPRQLPALPTGWIRDYFFYADGFEKDLDFYAAHAFTVEPLPRHSLLPYPYPEGRDYPGDAEHLGYQLEYNTRSRSERLPPSLRYHYSSPHSRKLLYGIEVRDQNSLRRTARRLALRFAGFLKRLRRIAVALLPEAFERKCAGGQLLQGRERGPPESAVRRLQAYKRALHSRNGRGPLRSRFLH